MAKRDVAVLISGSGSNLQALIDAVAADPDHPARIRLVISNRPGVYGLERAAAAGIEAVVIDHRTFPDRAAFDAALHAELEARGIELVCLAGFMRILTAPFVEAWTGRMLNIHPSILPAFKGARAIDDALAAGVRITGVTVHYVVPEMDAGPIVVQAAVPVLPGDDHDALAKRIHAAEHRIYPAALRWVAAGDVRLAESGHVEHLTDPVAINSVLISPPALG
ncbi:phosphoribosylglycinamide formyltransferase [Tistrella mobilis]|jgi:phosphoribosylglycinamide formyltransferase-1|uniref:phosphoribosylglycinamide formyltransferase n=1 Tax=Tistrella mobilis TaxID=171437 RepID=UPI003557EF0F